MILEIAVANISRNMSKITSILEEKQVEVLAISTDYQDKEMVKIEFLLESGNSIPISEILSKLSGIYGVKDAKYKSAAGY